MAGAGADTTLVLDRAFEVLRAVIDRVREGLAGLHGTAHARGSAHRDGGSTTDCHPARSESATFDRRRVAEARSERREELLVRLHEPHLPRRKVSDGLR